MRIVNFIKIFRNLFVVLFLSWLFLSPVPEKTENSVKGVEIVSTIRGGGGVSDSNQTQISPIRMPEVSKPRQDTSIPGPTSIPKSTSLPGGKIRYSPGGNGGGNPSSPPSYDDELLCPKIPEPNEVINDPYFWSTLQDSKSEEEKEESDNDMSDIKDWDIDELVRKELLAGRRRLFSFDGAPSSPTTALDKQNLRNYDLTTGSIPKFSYKDQDGRTISMSNKPLKKIAYSHQTELGIYNLADRIKCPVQQDPSKFQRTDCWAVTDRSVKDVIIKVFELTTMSDLRRYVTLSMPMPFFPTQKTLGYLDKQTGECIFFHENGSLWSAIQFEPVVVRDLLNNPDVTINPPL